MKLRFFLQIILFFPLFVFSQNLRHLSVDDGLPQSFVSGIVEDSKNFVWISTRNGLARFDGSKFKIFQSGLPNSNTLSSNIIDHIKPGNNNSMWIKYETDEIDRFDFATEKPTAIITSEFLKKYKLAIHRKIWCITASNTFWFKTQDGILYSFNLDKPGNPVNWSNFLGVSNVIYGIFEDSNKRLWILSSQGLYLFDNTTQKFNRVNLPDTYFYLNKGKGKEYTAFCERANGELMWFTDKSLCFYHPDKKTYRSVNPPLLLPQDVKLVDINANGKEYFFSQNKIFSYGDNAGIRYEADVKLSGNRDAQAFLVDQAGLIWIGSDADGLYTIDTKTNFKSFDYKEEFCFDILREAYGISGKDFFNWKDIKGIVNASYYFRSEYHDDKYWMALGRAVGYYDVKKKKTIKLPELPKQQENIFLPIKGITTDGKGQPVVIDKNNIIYTYNDSQKRWGHLIPLDYLTNKLFENVMSNDIHIDTYESKIWISTELHGLLSIDIKTGVVNRFQSGNSSGLPTNNLIIITPDTKDKNILWIGSSKGLVRFNKITAKCDVFSVKEGMPDNVIYSILPDEKRNLWIGTNKGLICFNTVNFKIRTFTKSHGLKGIEFNRFHQLMLPDGKFAFGGPINGVEFSPNAIKEDRFIPFTALTDMKLNNNQISSVKPNLLPVNNISYLELPYTENTISFSYTALEFSYPGDIAYRYRLSGYDNGWINVGNKKEAVYTKLPPGKYTFEVNATNTSGVWSKHVKSIDIKITPPWWRTWWALLLYVVIIIISIVWFINFRIKQATLKHKMLIKLDEAKELRRLDKIKTRFFANIAHEFRTPLSLILGPAEQLRADYVEDRQKLLDIINKNTHSLINLTDQLLDIAKLEAGVLKPQMVWGDIISPISNIVTAFNEEASAKNVRIKMEAPSSADFFFSINTLDRILYNLLSNALKYSNPGDTIKVEVNKKAEGLLLIVTDNGKGIPKEEQLNIFKRYYRVFDQEQHDGSGIGLSLVRELVELHKGKITVESRVEDPSGTTFSVWLPLLKHEKETVKEKELISDSKEKLTILIVEDHEELKQFIVDSLKNEYIILTARNGVEGLEIAKEKMPDLIVSDVTMDEMDGYEFCKAIKKDITINHLPVILLTAKADIDSKLAGLSFGANDYITKPFNIAELHLRIRNQLKLQKQQRDYFHNKFVVPEGTQTEEEIQNAAQHNEFLDRIHEIIDENLDDKNFSVDELAGALFMSRASLHRKVKAMFDLPASEIIKIYRLKKAAELLKDDYTVSEVAYMTGFNTPSYFSKCFKEYFGTTPAKYAEK